MKPKSAHFFDGLLGKFTALVELCCNGGNLFLSEISGCIAEHFVFVAERVNGKICHCFLHEVELVPGLYRYGRSRGFVGVGHFGWGWAGLVEIGVVLS
jgi:hypothetical protein